MLSVSLLQKNSRWHLSALFCLPASNAFHSTKKILLKAYIFHRENPSICFLTNFSLQRPSHHQHHRCNNNNKNYYYYSVPFNKILSKVVVVGGSPSFLCAFYTKKTKQVVQNYKCAQLCELLKWKWTRFAYIESPLSPSIACTHTYFRRKKYLGKKHCLACKNKCNHKIVVNSHHHRLPWFILILIAFHSILLIF